jgi:hypothetical protein
VGFDFGTRSRVWNTFDAHRLLHWAGLIGVQLELKRALLVAYHTHDQNPGAHDVLLQVVSDLGLDVEAAREVLTSGRYADEVRARQAHYRQLGINAVPSVIIDDRHLLQGGQPPDVYEQALRQIAAGGTEQSRLTAARSLPQPPARRRGRVHSRRGRRDVVAQHADVAQVASSSWRRISMSRIAARRCWRAFQAAAIRPADGVHSGADDRTRTECGGMARRLSGQPRADVERDRAEGRRLRFPQGDHAGKRRALFGDGACRSRRRWHWAETRQPRRRAACAPRGFADA